MTNPFSVTVKITALDLGWWKLYYPTAFKYIVKNNILYINVKNQFSYYLVDFNFFSKNKKYNFIIDYYKPDDIYGLLFFDENLVQEQKSYYFCIVQSKYISFLNEDLKNQILNYALLE